MKTLRDIHFYLGWARDQASLFQAYSRLEKAITIACLLLALVTPEATDYSDGSQP